MPLTALRPRFERILFCREFTRFLFSGRNNIGFQTAQRHSVIEVIKGRNDLWILLQSANIAHSACDLRGTGRTGTESSPVGRSDDILYQRAPGASLVLVDLCDCN